MDPRKEAVGLTELGRFATALCGACPMTLRRERGPAQELEPMQRRVAITIAELSEHVFDERRLENRVGGADADAGGGQAELHFPAVDGIEHARDIALLHELADGDRHRGRRNAEMVREVAEHHRPLGVEVVHDADLSRADANAAFGIADVASVTGEVNAWVVAEHARDVVGQAHGPSLAPIVSFVNTNNSCAQRIGPTAPSLRAAQPFMVARLGIQRLLALAASAIPR